MTASTALLAAPRPPAPGRWIHMWPGIFPMNDRRTGSPDVEALVGVASNFPDVRARFRLNPPVLLAELRLYRAAISNGPPHNSCRCPVAGLRYYSQWPGRPHFLFTSLPN